MSRIRILRVIARMNVGGPAVQITGLMRNLDPEVFDQRLVTGYCADDEADYLETQAPDVEAIRIQGLGRAIKLADDLQTMPRLISMIRDFRPHIIHTHTAKAGLLGRVAARAARTNARVVHTYHGHLLHSYFTRAKTDGLILLERLLAYSSDALVAVGPQVRDDLLAAKIGTPGKFVVIPPGLTLNVVPPREEARAALDLDVKAPVIGMIGRLTTIKRPDRFLDAAKLLHAIHPDVTFIVAGAGDSEASLREEIESSGLPIRLLGWRSDIEVLLAACNVLVLTSDNEGTPLSLIQAALAGIPVVATNVGSVKDIVIHDDTGLLCPTDPQAISVALSTLISEPLVATAMGERARIHALEHYGVQRLADDHSTLYQQLIQKIC